MCSKSSFSGKIDEIPAISVDNFENTDSKAYFLSHCHTDHTQGLYSDAFLEYLNSTVDVFIYMSSPSVAIITHESRNKGIVRYLKPLRIGSSLIAIPASKNNKEQYVTIALIPAGHCFGSVMFIFKTIYKNILYTGDFRISENSVSKYAHFHDNGKVVNIDAMYVDTTFQYVDNFPKRSDSVQYVIEEIGRFLSLNVDNKVALHTSAKYGYEFVFNEVFKKLGMKVYVDAKKWEFYSQFPNLVPGVTNEEKTTNIHVCLNRSHNMPHGRCLKNQHGHFLYIHFSAMKWSNFQLEDKLIEKSENRIDVCFPTHCSKSELVYFISYFSPKRIIGFPEPYIIYDKFDIDTPCKRKICDIEGKVRKTPRKVDRNVLREIFADI